VAGRARTGASGDHDPGCFRLHHGHHEEAGTTGLEPAASRLTSERSARLSYAPEGRGGRRDRLPATGDRDVAVRSAPEPAVAHRHSCQRVSAPPPPHRLALEACRSQPHVRARALHQPLFCHFLGPPVGGSILDSAGGIRTHGLELMRLARTAAPLPRKSGWQESNLRSPAPEAGGVPSSPTARRRTSTPGGTRTRSFRVEGPASSPFRPRGLESSGGRARTCALASNSRASYRLDHAGTKGGGSRTRTCERLATVCALATRCLASSAMPPRAEGEGVEPPRPESPPVFETGYRAGGSPSEGGPGRRRTCNPPLKRRQLCQLSYGALM
jgi:hypothetical protein